MENDMNRTIEWLLEGDPWVVYKTRIDLLHQNENNSKVIKAHTDMINNPKIQSLLIELKNWPAGVLNSHKSASQPFHKLSFIADIGLTKNDPGINEIIEKVYEHKSEEGPFQLSMNIPEHFGGTGKDQWAWALCDAPVVIYSLIKFGLKDDLQVKKTVKYIASVLRENGWPCAVSKELGKFRGPGRKNDPCPYATLVSLKMFLELDKWKNSKEVKIGAETLLSLWENSKNNHPYMFYMGTDFRKIKTPFIWYDILHVLEVLAKVESISKDKRFKDMINLLKQKRNPEGKYAAESEWKAWKDWDFGQKKQPSRWITFLAMRMLNRMQA
jgi:hypothetical protein